MNEIESKLINEIFISVQKLYCNLCKEEVNKCGLPGICGPSSNQKDFWSWELGDLQSIIFMLKKIQLK